MILLLASTFPFTLTLSSRRIELDEETLSSTSILFESVMDEDDLTEPNTRKGPERCTAELPFIAFDMGVLCFSGCDCTDSEYDGGGGVPVSVWEELSLISFVSPGIKVIFDAEYDIEWCDYDMRAFR